MIVIMGWIRFRVAILTVCCLLGCFFHLARSSVVLTWKYAAAANEAGGCFLNRSCAVTFNVVRRVSTSSYPAVGQSVGMAWDFDDGTRLSSALVITATDDFALSLVYTASVTHV